MRLRLACLANGMLQPTDCWAQRWLRCGLGLNPRRHASSRSTPRGSAGRDSGFAVECLKPQAFSLLSFDLPYQCRSWRCRSYLSIGSDGQRILRSGEVVRAQRQCARREAIRSRPEHLDSRCGDRSLEDRGIGMSRHVTAWKCPRPWAACRGAAEPGQWLRGEAATET